MGSQCFIVFDTTLVELVIVDGNMETANIDGRLATGAIATLLGCCRTYHAAQDQQQYMRWS